MSLLNCINFIDIPKHVEKIKMKACRFKFGKFFSKETLVAEYVRRSKSIVFEQKKRNTS